MSISRGSCVSLPSVLSQHGPKMPLLGRNVKAAKNYKNTSLILSSTPWKKVALAYVPPTLLGSQISVICISNSSLTIHHRHLPSFLPTKNFRNVFHHFVSHPSTLFPKFESMLVRSCQYHDFTSTPPGRRPWFHCWGT